MAGCCCLDGNAAAQPFRGARESKGSRAEEVTSQRTQEGKVGLRGESLPGADLAPDAGDAALEELVVVAVVVLLPHRGALEILQGHLVGPELLVGQRLVPQVVGAVA